jgi:hypothetical protein
MNENKSTTRQNVRDIAKVVLGGKYTSVNI